MNKIAVNPGSGEIGASTWEQAYENIQQYINDCEIPMHIVSTEFYPDDGRYLFTLKADNYDWQTDIQMPGLPLEQVRYMCENGQSVYDFHRLYVDGSSWLWIYALVTKAGMRDILTDKLEEAEYQCDCIKQQLENLK